MYDRFIRIERNTKTVNTVGTPHYEYAFLKNKFAHVSYSGGATGAGQFGESTRTDAVFTVRHDPAIDYKCRIVFNQSYYVIDHIEIMGRNERMRIKTVMHENNEG